MALTSSSTYDDALAQYLDNNGYDVNGSVTECKLCIRALRFLKHLVPKKMQTGSESIEEMEGKYADELKKAEAWLTKNDTTYGGNQSVGRTVSTSCEYFRG